MSAVFFPALANAPARGVPAWPEPIITMSYFLEDSIEMCVVYPRDKRSLYDPSSSLFADLTGRSRDGESDMNEALICGVERDTGNLLKCDAKVGRRENIQQN